MTVGTSAGSTAAAQLAGATAPELYAAVIDSAPQQPAGTVQPRPATQVNEQLERMKQLIASATDVIDMRRKIGAAALEREAASDGSWQGQWRATVASRLSSAAWPQRTVQFTAVDAGTGEPVVFDRHSGVDLVDAVAASCASGLPYRIAGTPYLDGGYRASAENADLAAGCARVLVLVLSAFGGRTLQPLDWGLHLGAQVEHLRTAGSSVEILGPPPEAEQGGPARRRREGRPGRGRCYIRAMSA